MMETNQIHDFRTLFLRDLQKLKSEVESYSIESDLWLKKGEIKNSAGNLTLHICGNLKHFIGAQLANSGYVRNRPFEFEGKVSRQELIDEVESTTQMIQKAFDSISREQLDGVYPLEVFGYQMSNFYFIVHLQGHLNYHLGQINYHRRLVTF